MVTRIDSAFVSNYIFMNDILLYIKQMPASFLLIMVLLSISGLLVLSFLLYKRRTAVAYKKQSVVELNKKDNLIAQQQKEIERQKTEFNQLAQTNQQLEMEIQHRVKNNLQTITSLMALQSANVDDMIALKTLTESQSRVQSLAIMHQGMYKKGKHIGIEFENYLKELFDNIANLFNIEINDAKINYNGSSFTFDLDTAIPLSLIFNELMTNSFKYAYAIRDGSLNISVKEIEDVLHITYFDDGISVNQNRHIKNFGSKLINLLCKQLGGFMEVIETDSGIVLYEFEFVNYVITSPQIPSSEGEKVSVNQVRSLGTQTHTPARSGSL